MKIPVITGPTASGKTDFVLKLAEHFNIEIVSADAYQVYKNMDIGTAKPKKKELKKVPHHLIDILTPDKTYSAGDFFENCEEKVKEILSRGNLPVVVGGTGLYVETLIKGIFKGPSRNDELRNELRNIAKKKGLEYLYNVLKKVDPDYAAKISPNDLVRIIRALEVYEVMKIPFTKAHELFQKKPAFSYEIFVFYREREVLYDKINRRVELMFEEGWIEEVNKLLEMGYSSKFPSFKAIGYSEIEFYLKNREYNIGKLIEDIQKKTRRFAKRQFTWFRNRIDAIWINIDEMSFEEFKEKMKVCVDLPSFKK